jgi:hypothetical protein
VLAGRGAYYFARFIDDDRPSAARTYIDAQNVARMASSNLNKHCQKS